MNLFNMVAKFKQKVNFCNNTIFFHKLLYIYLKHLFQKFLKNDSGNINRCIKSLKIGNNI